MITLGPTAISQPRRDCGPSAITGGTAWRPRPSGAHCRLAHLDDYCS
jgi:hypothetical protein